MLIEWHTKMAPKYSRSTLQLLDMKSVFMYRWFVMLKMTISRMLQMCVIKRNCDFVIVSFVAKYFLQNEAVLCKIIGIMVKLREYIYLKIW